MEPVNILLVDDQPSKLLSYEVILQELGENLIKAKSGREALEQLLKTEIAVILVDVCMPEQDGFELVAMIREHPRFQKIAIIFVSAVMMAEPDRLRGYEAGAVDYVSVPVVPELLRAKVKIFAELYRKTRELERLNAELEQRVTDRTAELRASSAELVALNEQLERRVEERTREREDALAQLFEAQKLDTIGQLTGGVAHDFNNLLMAALGSLNLLRKHMPLDERNLRLLDNAIQANERGSALTQRLLAFARRQELKPVAVDFEKLLGSIEGLFEKAVGPAITLSKDLSGSLPFIKVDANQLELALLNLLLNARDAMPGGGTISIRAQEDKISVASAQGRLEPGSYVRITVADSGVGMDDETSSRAAEPFFTTKGLGKGTGLGLSMVHGLAAQSGGALQLSSAPGYGTEAFLWIPVADGSPELKCSSISKRQPTEEVPESRLRILVVDDDALVCLGTVAILEDLGHEVIDVNSGAAALEVLRSQNVDLVITDQAMPEMTGIELVRQIHQSGLQVPVILASGYAELPKDPFVDALGRLTKPFNDHQLKAAIANAVAAGPMRL